MLGPTRGTKSERLRQIPPGICILCFSRRILTLIILVWDPLQDLPYTGLSFFKDVREGNGGRVSKRKVAESKPRREGLCDEEGPLHAGYQGECALSCRSIGSHHKYLG